MPLSNFDLTGLTPLNHQLPLFYKIRFRLPAFILRHLNSFFLQYVCFCLLDWDLLKAFRHFKMKECVWLNIQKHWLPNSHWISQSFTSSGGSTVQPCRLFRLPSWVLSSLPLSGTCLVHSPSFILRATKFSAIQFVEKICSNLEHYSAKQSLSSISKTIF